MLIRNIRVEDIIAIQELSKESVFLKTNNSYSFYRIFTSYFKSICFVIEINKVVVGFLLSTVSEDNKVLYIWKLGVKRNYKGLVRGRDLIYKTIEICLKKGYKNIEFSIEQSNLLSIHCSKKAFLSRGFKMKHKEMLLYYDDFLKKDIKKHLFHVSLIPN